MTLDWPALLGPLVDGVDLDAAMTESALGEVMAGEASPAQLAGLLVGLRAKGETVAEITGFVRAMRAAGLTVPLTDGPTPIDTCGTGGDRAGTFNVSTVAAIVAAGAGARVVKHGNRAASSRCGSADLLEAWGVVIDLPPVAVAECVEEVGMGFCFAQTFHPAMRHVMPTRRDLGVPTVFNYLGPLTNPARVRHQAVGVSDPDMAPKMAAALAELGAVRALVFHGHDGLDELSTTGPSQLWDMVDGAVEECVLDPVELGLTPATLPDLRGGDISDNRRIADAVLAGARGPARDIVALNAAAGLLVGDYVTSWEEGLAAAASSLDTGAAADVRDRFVAASRRLATGAD